MTFQTVPINIVGQESKSRSRSFSRQKTVNLYPDAPQSGKAPTILYPWPGLLNFHVGSGGDRGIYVMNGVLYRVAGQTLYSIAANGLRTSLGTIAGTGRVNMEGDGTNLVISTGVKRYIYVVGGSTTEITDTDHEPGNSAAFINSQMVMDGSGGRFQTTDVGTPSSISALNYATAESAPDDTIFVKAKNQVVYLFGEESIEPWDNTGVGSPPFDRIRGGVLEIGLGAVHSVAETEEFIYFVANNKTIYRLSGYQAQQISPPSISNEVEDFSDYSDAYGYTCEFDGQKFYIVTFPSGGKTYGYSETTGSWFTLASGQSQSMYYGSGHAFVYGKRLISDRRNGNVYELDPDTYKDYGDTIIRERVTAPFNGAQMGVPGQRLVMSGVEFILELGTGLVSGQGALPQVMMSASFDGGKSFTGETFTTIGREGDDLFRVKWDYMKSFYEIMIRIRISDPVYFAIHGCGIKVKADGSR